MPVPNDVSRSLIAWSVALTLHVAAGTAVYLKLLAARPAVAAVVAHDGGARFLYLALPVGSARAEAGNPAAAAPAATISPPVGEVGATRAAAAGADGVDRNATTMPAPAPGLGRPATLTGGTDTRLATQFLDQIAAHIERHRLGSASVGHTGVVWLRILLQRDGQVVRSWIDRGSGDAALDAEGLAAVRGAEPLPGIPTGLPDTIDLTVPIEFGAGR